MATFVINSTGRGAVRKSEVRSLEITLVPLHTDPETYKYILSVKMEDTRVLGLIFEEDATLGGIQAKAATVLAALEAP